MNISSQNTQLEGASSNLRVSWVDIVKGMSIFLVVMMHSTLGVQTALGESSWMGAIVEFARPFRIPCFMLISGLFLHRSIDAGWSQYQDRKILHFVYFYILWLTIQIVIKTPAWMGEGQTLNEIAVIYVTAFVQPFGTLWFIYLLPVFYFVTRVLRNVDWKWLLAAGALLQIMPIHTGSMLVDEFASRYIYFLIGYVFYRQIFSWAEYVVKNPIIVVLFLATWGLANLILINNLPPQILSNLASPTGPSPIVKLADMPIISLGLGIMGAMAMITLGSVFMNIKWLGFLRWVGARSIVVYLAFFLPMGISQIVLIKFAGDFLSTGTIAALVTLSAAIGPLVFYRLVKLAGVGGFLFKRPAFARLNQAIPNATGNISPAE
ncbi:MAG: acyltransferase family protein [Hyphomicrobiales bacterium]|nr:acyltransferase family protein [Hyphomicrobiales bacterium]